MVKDREIDRYRAKFDVSLSSPDLRNVETVKTLVRNQLEGCSEAMVDRRSNVFFNLIDMMRSASSVSRQSSWKIKDDAKDFRVMYRPETDGPFHSLLIEGCVDAALDKCLCISLATQLFGKWWPQSTVPPFKLTLAERIQRLPVDDQVSLVRMKVPWPMTSREALMHLLKLEYFKEEMIIVVFNSITDSEVEEETHGFKRDCIPEAKDVVRVDVVGGFVLQKVSNNRSYFRTITKMDFKLDVVPASLINFASRQLLGKGFKLYKKTVTSMERKEDEDFMKELRDPMYGRIRRILYKENGKKEEEEYHDCTSSSSEEEMEDEGNGVLGPAEEATCLPETVANQGLGQAQVT